MVINPVRDRSTWRRAWCRCSVAHLVPGAVDIEPFPALSLPGKSGADFGIEDFRTTAGKRVEARAAQDFERFPDRLLRDPFGEVPDFDGGEGLDVRLGHAASVTGSSPCNRQTAVSGSARRPCELGDALCVGFLACRVISSMS